jgi:O-antigen/teichoic acid export membrane protein
VGAVRQSLWISLADSYLSLVLRLASTAIIARLLTPQEIGVLAVAAVFTGLAGMFRDFGVAEYMIQEKELTQRKIAATLTLNIIVSWSMAAAMFGGSNFAAAFYKDDGVGEVMRLQAVCFLLVPFGAVTMAYFRRELNFRPLLICNILGNVTGFVVSVVLALMGFGYMSLAWATLAAMIVTVGCSMWYRPAHFPRWPGWSGVPEVFHFSKFASLVYLFGQVGKGAPEMIIGRALGMAEVAMFSRAGGLVEMFQRMALRPVMFVCMPYFARNDREQGEIAAAYLKSVSYLTAVGWPFLAFMGIAALSAIRIVYGPQWDAAVPVAQILVAAFAIELVHAMSREALLARGHARSANSLQIWIVLLQVAGLLVAVPHGIQSAALGVCVASLAGAVVAQVYLKRHLGLSTRRLLATCGKSLLVTLGAIAPAAIWALYAGVTLQNYVVFGIFGALLTLLAWLGTLILMDHPVMEEVRSLAARLRNRLLRRQTVEE